jgi:hypothetical protein
MVDKFNLTTNKIAIQFTDESISFIKIIYNKSVFKFDRDFRSLKKWEFHAFDYRPTFSEEKTIEKFRNKFLKLF